MQSANTLNPREVAADMLPEQLVLLYPQLGEETVKRICARYAGNVRKQVHMLNVAVMHEPARISPGVHGKLALDRPQGGPPMNWAETLLMDYAMTREDESDDRPEVHVSTHGALLASVRLRLGDKRLALLGDTSRHFAHVTTEMDMLANNS